MRVDAFTSSFPRKREPCLFPRRRGSVGLWLWVPASRGRQSGSRSPAALHLGDRLLEQFVHGAADLVIGLGDTLGVEVLAELAKHVMVAGFFEIRQHDFLGIGVGFGAGKSKLLGRPQAEHLVAPGHRLEFELLVERELLFESFLALVERRHVEASRRVVAPDRGGASWRLAYRAKMAKSTAAACPQRRIAGELRRDCALGGDRLGCRKGTGGRPLLESAARSCAADPKGRKPRA